MSQTDPYAAPDVYYPSEDTQKAYEASQKPVEVTEEEAAAIPEDEKHDASEPAVIEEVPTGTISEITEWVGTDADRAQRALDAETAGEGRKTLIKNLKALV